MSIYLGVKCPVCARKFSSGDDVVVCPVCGAPHHRECYAEKGVCAFEGDHLSGKVWHAPAEPRPAEESKTVYCPRCNSANAVDSVSCQICGMRLHVVSAPGGTEQKNGAYSYSPGSHGGQGAHNAAHEYSWGIPGLNSLMDPAVLMYGNLSPDEEIEGEVVRDLALYIGESSAYYLGRFKVISNGNRSLTANFAALFFSFFYFFYRKMYFYGCILLGVYILGLIPQFLHFSQAYFPQIAADNAYIAEFFRSAGLQIPREVNEAAVQHYAWLANISRWIGFAVRLLFALCANRLYYNKVIKSVHRLRSEFGEQRDERAYVEALSRDGGYSKPAVIAIAATLFVVYFTASGVLSYILMTGG